ncbi:hypothetical protein PCNPT3_11370 [Psychromonas sp. CNPT3]|uniref:YheU family protein n=1 Tax=Psychromonas sp. CNPT3 TaxID=314282 RepID=UPI00006E9E89|nr:YheU family protein [Psychromonas sp. CNPT3]AGH82210.1 hypothetical protein PCNPT3_11370 [Psychromonas sp. CNPT3]
MQINYQDLETETLHNLIEHFILREGTDYGEHEISLSEKRQQVLRQLKMGDILILYSELHESITLIHKNQLNENKY